MTTNYKYGDWTGQIKAYTSQFMKHFKGKNNLNFLEIGAAEGRSANYFVDNFLTGDNCKITCIDPWLYLSKATEQNNYTIEDNWCIPENEKFFLKNTQYNKDKIIVKKGFSKDIVPTLQDNFYDFVYIDGDHAENAVYTDACMSFKVTKNKGIISFDDAQKNYSDFKCPKRVAANVGSGGNTKKGIDRFLEEYKGKYKILIYGYQVVIQKTV
tara:strand:+ start:4384 stop:5019 length:636 start_codon:yes stop_codon:yes gene_type:complete